MKLLELLTTFMAEWAAPLLLV